MNTMLRMTLPVILLALAGLILAGCPTQAELSAEGKKVEFIENPEVIKDKLEDAEKCKLVATLRITGQGSTSSVTKKSRMEDEQKDRLVRARNSAARNGANVLIADGELQGRSQSFKAYQCK
ncbi:MAG: hypothetical protein O7B79_13220 [SAR324 cluster bacterium]|nr:hypothetical protein [SAR324 cluster bacterium]